MSISRRGEKSPSWKGGISKLNDSIRSNYKYRLWRSDVFTRDKFTCQECGKSPIIVEAHHLQSLSSIMFKYDIKNLEQALSCDKIWDVNNGITLCHKCHTDTDSYANNKLNQPKLEITRKMKLSDLQY